MVVIIYSSKALHRPVADAFGNDVPLQGCRVHKMRNVLDHLPDEQRPWMRRKLASVWAETDADRAETALRALAAFLERDYPRAPASPRKGLEETITISRLMLEGALRRTLRSTNPIESAIEMARTTARRVKRWRNGNQVLRWTLAGLQEAERRFRRVAGYRELPLLRMRLKGEVSTPPRARQQTHETSSGGVLREIPRRLGQAWSWGLWGSRGGALNSVAPAR